MTVQSERTFNALTVQATANAAAAELRAERLAAEAAKQLAACCCDMQLMQKDTLAAILVSTTKVTDLINANTVQDLRDALAALGTRTLGPLP